MFHYFNAKLSSGFVALYTGRMLQFAGSGILGLFLPVYLLIQFKMEVSLVLIWYLAGSLFYAILLPLGAQFFNKFGLRRSIRISVFLDAFFIAAVYFIARDPAIFVPLSIFMLVWARLFFWLPFHVDFAKFTSRGDRGKEVSIIWATKSFLGITMPIISGLLITRFNFSIVFIIAIVLYAAAIIPFMALPRTREKYEWKYWETFKNFIKKSNRPLVFSNMAYGAENAVALIIWPIFIWQLLKGNYVAMGVISSIIVLVGVIIQLIAGKYTDKFDKRKMLHWGTIFYSLGWLAKAFVLSGFHIFIAGAYHQIAQIFKDTPFDTLNYELLADRGHYVDEYTVIKEIAVQMGKVVMLIFAILVVFTLGLNWTFVLAAIASLLINFL